jgi:hypothetical protein
LNCGIAGLRYCGVAIPNNELADDKDALEREKGYLSEAQRNIDKIALKEPGLKTTPKQRWIKKETLGWIGSGLFIITASILEYFGKRIEIKQKLVELELN